MLPNAKQKSIITASTTKPLLITAGAGTGKTSTLTDRFVYLMNKEKLASDRILLLTFTKKAAAEMKDRILQKYDLSVLERENLWVHTFHSFCARLLRDEALAFSVSVDFEPIDAGEQKLLYQEVYALMNNLEGEFRELSEQLSFFDISLYKKFSAESYKAICFLRDNLITAEHYSKIIKKCQTDSQPYIAAKLISLLYNDYELKLDELGVKDFPKLIMDTVLGLKNNNLLRDKYRKKFSYVMVDEFQDTSRAQFELLKLVCREKFSNINAVGDPRQSIYQWRNADPRNLLWLKEEAKNLAEKELTVNYRSYGEILQFAQSLLNITDFKDMPPVEPQSKDFFKNPAIFCFEDKDGNEPFFIAEQIKHLVNDQGYKPDDIAVLFRKIKNRVEKFEYALTLQNIPFYTSGSGSFFEREEIVNLTAYLRLIDNPLDINALVRILTRRPYSLPDSKLYDLKCAAKLQSVSMFDYLPKISSLEKLHKLILDFSGIKNSVSILDLTYMLIEKIGLEKILFSEKNQTANYRDSLSKFINLVNTFGSRHATASLSSFIKFFNEGSLELEDNEDLEEIQAKNCVRIMTLHKAKGLEFPVVFLADTNSFKEQCSQIKKNLSTQNFFFFDGNLNIVLKNSNEYENIKNAKAIERANELWRLYYVGITRAKEQLYITGKNLETFRELLNGIDDANWHEFNEIPEYMNENTPALFDEKRFMDDLIAVKQNLNKDKNSIYTVKKPLFLSCSVLHEFSECPYRFYLKNILSAPAPENTDKLETEKIRWDLIGTIIHQTIERFHKNRRLINLFDIADLQIEKFKTNGISEPKIKDALSFYETTPYFTDDENSYFSEYPFTLRFENGGLPIELNGQIDRLYKEKKKCRIIDFKTGSKSATDQYRFQMLLYALACRNLFGIMNIEVEIVYLAQQKIDTFKVTENDLISCEKKLCSIAVNIAKQNFAPLKTNKCAFCSHKQLCEKFTSLTIKDFFADEHDYYRHFYDLIDLEEKQCCENIEQPDPIGIKYLSYSYLDNHEDVIVNYKFNNSFLRIRQGDFVKLQGNKVFPVKAQTAYVNINKIGFIVKGLHKWDCFHSFSEATDNLPFTRMKDNLFEFLKSSSYLKQCVLHTKALPFDNKGNILPQQSSVLDVYQWQAVSKAVAVQDVLLVQGPPGSGKTLTIAHMVNEFMRLGKRVLISAYTNRSVDAILKKLVTIVPDNMKQAIARVGRDKIVDESLHDIIIDENLSPYRIGLLLNSKNVVALTAAGIRAEFFDDKFDAAVIDEATQMPEPFALAIVNNTSKLILVGDDKQLQPIITNKKAAKAGFCVSLFERLKKKFELNCPNNVIMLCNQYRMNNKLMRFSADTFYGSMLKAATPELAKRKYIEPEKIKIEFEGWIKKIIDPENEIIFVKVKHSKNFSDCVFTVLKDGFLRIGIDIKKIGVISPYRHEVSSLRKIINFPGLEIDTVDRFQGSDKEIVILSCPCYNNEIPELMKKPNRLNVAITRAKSKLVIIGKFPDSPAKNLIFGSFMNYINKNAKIVDYYN
ncbi:UvrD-helicase domain-containing protein, partial [bacterium]|nr:UvrD-helicase domain-containing protein [bacterium]